MQLIVFSNKVKLLPKSYPQVMERIC